MTLPFNRVAADHWDRLDGLSFEARAILTCLLTTRHRTAAQAFRVPAAYVAADTGATVEQVEAALDELEQAGRILRSGDSVLIVDGHRHDPPGNTNTILHRISLWRDGRLPDGDPHFRARCLTALAAALEAALKALRPTESAKENEVRRRAAEAIKSMLAEAAQLDDSGTIPERFPNDSEIISKSRARTSPTPTPTPTPTTTTTVPPSPVFSLRSKTGRFPPTRSIPDSSDEITMLCKDGRERITIETIEEWQAFFPTLDVPWELETICRRLERDRRRPLRKNLRSSIANRLSAAAQRDGGGDDER